MNQEQKDNAWKVAKQKIVEEGYTGDWNRRGNNKKRWYVDLQPEDIDDLTNEELDSLIYDYKGNIQLFKMGSKEPGFDGKYKYGEK